MEFFMKEFQKAAVTGSWELEVARESANKFRARAKGNEGRPNAESLDGIVGLT